ncbi:MAG: hypothetical protein LBQ50_11840 [Planctomycetaceae bacterium]|jgi:hypothetical protein|nr:hypothetical protein [Planctomycetaceae bacterium]
MFLFRFPILVVAMLLFFVSQGLTQNLPSDTDLTADVLIATLYAKTDAEKKYCENIIRLRDEKILPSRIFYGIYRKSISLEEKNRRFTYFQTGLEILCKREGIALDEFISFKSTNLFGITSKSTVTVSEKTSAITEKQNPLSFIYKLFRR